MTEKICEKCKELKTYSSFYKRWICESCHKTEKAEIKNGNN